MKLSRKGNKSGPEHFPLFGQKENENENEIGKPRKMEFPRISKTLERGPHRQFIVNDGNNKMRRKLYRKIEQKVKYITLVDLVSTETNIIAQKRKKGF